MAHDEIYYVHPTSIIDEGAHIGKDTKIWHYSHIRNADIGDSCIIGDYVYVDSTVKIGNNVKIQNHSLIYNGVTLEDGVFIGPRVTFTNDLYPKSINEDGSLKSVEDWKCTSTLVKRGAALGAGSVVLCGIEIGQWALSGIGSVILKNVPDHGLVVGNPAKLIGFIDHNSHRLSLENVIEEDEHSFLLSCGKNSGCKPVYIKKSDLRLSNTEF